MPLKLINNAISENPELVIGLLRSRLFSGALEEFLTNSSFLEELILKDDWLTQALCGFRAQAHLYVGMKGMRKDLGDSWTLRIAKMQCNDECRAALQHEVLWRRQALARQGGWNASWGLDMVDLLRRPNMPGLFLRELARSPGLLKGLTPDRMKESFGKLRITARPEVLKGYRGHTVSINVKSMRYKTALQEDPWLSLPPLPDDEGMWIANSLDSLPPSMLTRFLSTTLAGFIPALVSQSIMSDPAFPDVLNAALKPIKMDLRVSGGISASSDMQFLTNQERKQDMCP